MATGARCVACGFGATGVAVAVARGRCGAAAVGGITAVIVATGKCCGSAAATGPGRAQDVVFVVWFTK